MNAGNWFWIIYVICFVFGGFFGWQSGNRWVAGMGLVVFVLVGLLGWGIFGPPLK